MDVCHNVYMYVCMYICMYVCMLYMYVCTRGVRGFKPLSEVFFACQYMKIPADFEVPP